MPKAPPKHVPKKPRRKLTPEAPPAPVEQDPVEVPDVPPRTKYREEWLDRALVLLRELFEAVNYSVPDNVRVTCGWPAKGALAQKKRRIGECWSHKYSGDGSHEIMVSPLLDNPIRVLGVLAHEVVHATVGLECGHKAPFKACATAIGLEGKMTATSESHEFQVWAAEVVRQLGRYPHAKLDGNHAKKQTTRLLKMACESCGCTVRTTNKWIEEHGIDWPCPCGSTLTLEDA